MAYLHGVKNGEVLHFKKLPNDKIVRLKRGIRCENLLIVQLDNGQFSAFDVNNDLLINRNGHFPVAPKFIRHVDALTKMGVIQKEIGDQLKIKIEKENEHRAKAYETSFFLDACKKLGIKPTKAQEKKLVFKK